MPPSSSACFRSFAGLENVGREVPIQVGSPEGGPPMGVVFLNLRRTHEYREPAHKPFSFQCNAGNYTNRRISLWHNPLGFFSWGRYLKIHTEIKTESFQQKKCVGTSKLTLSVTLIRVNMFADDINLNQINLPGCSGWKVI